MTKYWVGLVVEVEAPNESEASSIAQELAAVLHSEQFVVQARWDNNYPEESEE